MRLTKTCVALAIVAAAVGIVLTITDAPAAGLSLAVGPQYDTAHVYVAPEESKVISDDHKAPGIEIGRPNDVYRRARMDSPFGKIAVLATDGHLPYPYGREIMGYEVDDLSNTLMKAKAAGASVVIEPYSMAGRQAAMVRFPGGFVAEIHSDNNK